MSLKLQSPWVTYYDKIRELFRQDDEIKMVFDCDAMLITMFVKNAKKAEALRNLLPAKKQFGNVTVHVNVITCANEEEIMQARATKATIEDAFEGNMLYHYTRTFDNVLGGAITYVVFAKKVIQYWNDDIGDLFGNANCLPEDLARDVLENTEGLFFSTDIL